MDLLNTLGFDVLVIIPCIFAHSYIQFFFFFTVKIAQETSQNTCKKVQKVSISLTTWNLAVRNISHGTWHHVWDHQLVQNTWIFITPIGKVITRVVSTMVWRLPTWWLIQAHGCTKHLKSVVSIYCTVSLLCVSSICSDGLIYDSMVFLYCFHEGSKNYGWRYDKCIDSSTTASQTKSGSNRWYVSYTDSICKQDCKNSSSLSCGGLANSWDFLYDTVEDCCVQRLYWVKLDVCISQSNGQSQDGSQKWCVAFLPCCTWFFESRYSW